MRIVRRIGRAGAAAAAAVALLGLASSGRASVSVRVEPGAASTAVGATFQVALVADLDDPVLGWGLDLAFDPAVIAPTGAPAIGPLWNLGVGSADGDGLAGGVLPGPAATGVAGTDVLLAELEFRALAPGFSELVLSYTPADFTEGFALDPSGFATDVELGGGSVTVVPEPATGALLGASLAALAAASRARRT